MHVVYSLLDILFQEKKNEINKRTKETFLVARKSFILRKKRKNV